MHALEGHWLSLVLSVEFLEYWFRSNAPELKLSLEYISVKWIFLSNQLAIIGAVVKQSSENGWVTIDVDSVVRIHMEKTMSVVISEQQFQFRAFNWGKVCNRVAHVLATNIQVNNLVQRSTSINDWGMVLGVPFLQWLIIYGFVFVKCSKVAIQLPLSCWCHTLVFSLLFVESRQQLGFVSLVSLCLVSHPLNVSCDCHILLCTDVNFDLVEFTGKFGKFGLCTCFLAFKENSLLIVWLHHNSLSFLFLILYLVNLLKSVCIPWCFPLKFMRQEGFTFIFLVSHHLIHFKLDLMHLLVVNSQWLSARGNL